MRKRWGSYEVIAQGKNFKVKILTVKPNGQTSIQKHAQRSEIWISLDNACCPKIRMIPTHAWHQLINRSDKERRILEIQLGVCREKDIVRFAAKKERT
jgi:mannose-6-phosphate isomerase